VCTFRSALSHRRSVGRLVCCCVAVALCSEAHHIFLQEIISDRYCILNGMQMVRDELQLSSVAASSDTGDISAAGADFSLPSVIVTQAHTNCGDRVQAATVPVYDRLVASRFANLSEFGDVKVERFTPAGGGTDNGRIVRPLPGDSSSGSQNVHSGTHRRASSWRM